ncbi:hypothetical protein LSH36_119g12006 [Paralvinella palmiformis]|uniref:Uncharacterized protein n=1 Tax=Paralvinella palmiformis TaxID=53620 RepID=A0AAD9JY28_9ANNE|nr:hypothetical protein LSH36_119g12006 [Paralvinella palmiformis]
MICQYCVMGQYSVTKSYSAISQYYIIEQYSMASSYSATTPPPPPSQSSDNQDVLPEMSKSDRCHIIWGHMVTLTRSGRLVVAQPQEQHLLK